MVLANPAFAYIVSILTYMMIALYGQNILRNVLEEKDHPRGRGGGIEASPPIRCSPARYWPGLVAITQVFAWVGLTIGMFVYLAPILLGNSGGEQISAQAAAARGLPADLFLKALPTPGIALMILAFFVFGFIFYSALFAAAGSMVSSQEDVQQASMPVMLMLVSSVLFMQPILIAPGGTISRVMSLIPFSGSGPSCRCEQSLLPVPWYELAARRLAESSLACVASIWLSARIYRVGLLMYGKKPSFAELRFSLGALRELMHGSERHYGKTANA